MDIGYLRYVAACKAKVQLPLTLEKFQAARVPAIKAQNEKTRARTEACRSANAYDIYGGDRP